MKQIVNIIKKNTYMTKQSNTQKSSLTTYKDIIESIRNREKKFDETIQSINKLDNYINKKKLNLPVRLVDGYKSKLEYSQKLLVQRRGLRNKLFQLSTQQQKKELTPDNIKNELNQELELTPDNIKDELNQELEFIKKMTIEIPKRAENIIKNSLREDYKYIRSMQTTLETLEKRGKEIIKQEVQTDHRNINSRQKTLEERGKKIIEQIKQEVGEGNSISQKEKNDFINEIRELNQKQEQLNKEFSLDTQQQQNTKQEKKKSGFIVTIKSWVQKLINKKKDEIESDTQEIQKSTKSTNLSDKKLLLPKRILNVMKKVSQSLRRGKSTVVNFKPKSNDLER